MTDLESTLSEVSKILRDAQNVLFVTGAGVSADSGIPTYRGANGLYDGELTEDGVYIEEALSATMFETRPELTWKYKWNIAAACLDAEPNAAHRVIAALESEKSQVWVVTQNVDGLHRRAGSENLVEMHGHNFDYYCGECAADFVLADLDIDFHQPFQAAPRCPDCDGMIRPDVVLFEEMLPEKALQTVRWLNTIDFDIVFTIGTTAVFPYIQQFVFDAHHRGIPTVEINPRESEITRLCSHHIPLGAADAMTRLREA